jgi:hypothetical protein
MDSLDRVEFVMALEQDFGVDLPDADAEALGTDPTLGAIWRTLRRLQGAPVSEAATPPASDPTWRRLAQLAARILDVPVDDVRWTDRPFRDPPGSSHPADS